MSKMQEIRAAAAAKLAAAKASIQPTPAKPAKPVIRVRAGGTVTEAMVKMALGLETFAQKLARWAESKREAHVDGGACPHCNGTGRYRFHTDVTRNEKCYRCDGKGRINQKDLAYLDRRIKGAGPVCWVVAAPAA